MVEIEYLPTKKIVIHAIQEIKESDFFENVIKNAIATGGNPQNLRFLWAKGVVLNVIHFNETPDIIRERMQGIQHVMRVEYVLLPEYKSNLVVRIQNIPYTVTLLKNDDPTFDEIADYVKGKKYLETRT